MNILLDTQRPHFPLYTAVVEHQGLLPVQSLYVLPLYLKGKTQHFPGAEPVPSLVFRVHDLVSEIK